MSLQSIPSSKSSEYNKMGLLEVFFMSICKHNTFIKNNRNNEFHILLHLDIHIYYL